MEIKTTAEIDLLKNAVYVVKDGKLQETTKPESGYGKQISAGRETSLVTLNWKWIVSFNR